MDEEACERFFSLDKAGRRKESKLAFRQFADSFETAEQRDKWAREFLEKQEFFDQFDRFGSRVRQELFDEILWPFLQQGVEQRRPPCLYWLAGLQQNLLVPSYRNYPADLSPICLLREAFAAEPTSLPIRRAFSLSSSTYSITLITNGQAVFSMEWTERIWMCFQSMKG